MTATFTCLGLNFTVEAAATGLQELVDVLYEPFASEAVATSRFAVIERRDGEAPIFDVYSGSRCARTTTEPALALAHLVWEIGQAVLRASSDGPNLLLHAAAAERNGQAVLLPAPSGWGKSTLVTGLIASGFRYLTDDVAPLDPVRTIVYPYPKPISVSHWLWPLFPQLRPLPLAWHPYLGVEGFLTAGALGASIGGPSVPRLVVVPHHRAQGSTTLTELSRAEAVQLFVEQSFNAGVFGLQAPAALTSMVRACSCFRLEYSDVGDAVGLLGEALSTAVSDYRWRTNDTA